MKNRLWPILKFGGPLLVWLFLFRRFLTGADLVSRETLYVYRIIKFFTDNISSGVFPLWDPFLNLGFPQEVLLAHGGIFNPLWMLMLLFNSLGILPYFSFLFSLLLYVLAGHIAFYWLSLILLKDKSAAYVSFLLFLFSSSAYFLFTNIHLIFIYIPAIWFFAFLFRFLQTWSPKYFLGLTAATLIILTTYLPFFFITAFLAVAIILCVLHFSSLPDAIKNGAKFIQGHPRLVGTCLLLCLFCFWPGWRAYQTTAQQDVVAPFRYGPDQNPDAYQSGVTFNLSYGSDGALTARMTLTDLFSQYTEYSLTNDGFFFISFWAYLLVLLGAFQRIRKTSAGLLLFFVFILLITLENTTPLHQWLYDHIFFFKFFRNRHFFLPFLTATFSLLAAWHFRNWEETLDSFSTKNQKTVALAAIFLIHGGCAIFLARQPYVPMSVFTTIAASTAFFSVSVFKPAFLRSNAGIALLLFLILFHPLKTFWTYTTEAPPVNKNDYITTPRKQPQFSFHRAMEMMTPFWHTITMQDAPGDLSYPNIFLPSWPFKLSQKLPEDILKTYTFSKFYLYQNVEPWTSSVRPENLASILWQKKDLVFLSDGSDLPPQNAFFPSPKISAGKTALLAKTISAASPDFQVLHFDANTIRFRSSFPKDYFLVYTDSYNPHWQATINGLPTQLYRAQFAFKGILLPAGPNDVTLSYQPPGGVLPYWGLLACIWGFFIYSGFWLFMDGRKQRSGHRG